MILPLSGKKLSQLSFVFYEFYLGIVIIFCFKFQKDAIVIMTYLAFLFI